LIGLMTGVTAEWIAKLTTSSFIGGRSLPDWLKMRPPGVSWESHYGGSFEQCGEREWPQMHTDARG
jgi:hypothetical protein